MDKPSTVDDGREEIYYQFVKLPDSGLVMVVDDNQNIVGSPLPMYRGGEVSK